MTYELNGTHTLLRHDADYYSVRLSVLADVPELDTMLDIDVYARVDYASGALDVFAATGHPGAEVPDGLATWAATRDVEQVCELLRQEHADEEDGT